jgi:hypothetical protein
MVWFFEGRADKISLKLSETGQWSVHGTATQDCRPGSGTFEILQHVRGLPAEWTIHSIEDAEHHYDGVGKGLKTFFEGNGGKSAALIDFFPATKDHKAIIGLNIVMPPELAAQVVVTFRTVMSNPAVRYVICAEFFGVHKEGVTGESIPSIDQFLHPDILRSRGYLSDEITISFRLLEDGQSNSAWPL